MDADFKARLVSALVSGKYEQGHMRLKAEGRYCCLGVACEIGLDMGLTSEEVSPQGFVTFYDDAGFRSDTHLPEHFAEEIGILEDDQSSLISMNDGDNETSRKSFDYIAAWIEQNL